MPFQERELTQHRLFPSCWAHHTTVNRSRITSNSEFLEVSGLGVQYIGPGVGDKDAASVRADNCVPLHCGLYYYEVEVVNKGRNGYVGIGFAAADVSLDRLPGWEPHSFGYHGDDGHAFHHSGKGTLYGPTFGTGDVIGIIYNRAERTIAYTKNGMHLGVAFSNVNEERLYPTVGMRTPGEEVVANFGATPFKGNVDVLIAEASERIQRQIANCKIETSKKGPRMTEQLIFDYLFHQGYWSTALWAGRDLICNATCVSPADLQDVQIRRQIGEAIVGGQIDKAANLIETAAPGLLTMQKDLDFNLKCQKFMLMVQDGNIEEAIAFGRIILAPAALTPASELLLQEALSLLAHNDVTTCPSYQKLLGEDTRLQLADSVNSAILNHQGKPERPCLETLIRQLEVVKCELLSRGDPASLLIDFNCIYTVKSKRL